MPLPTRELGIQSFSQVTILKNPLFSPQIFDIFVTYPKEQSKNIFSLFPYSGKSVL